MNYFPHPHHRSAGYANQKSQWTISEIDELHCYQRAVSGKWVAKGCYWGLHLEQAVPVTLGHSCVPEAHRLQIAKFVGSPDGDWHGYPVAPWLSTKDRPATSILVAWFQAGFISATKLGKLSRGKKCVL